ncbi:NADPH-dependent 3-keto-steroid reductase Hsd3b5-like isoform X2 [Amblyomma americanum]
MDTRISTSHKTDAQAAMLEADSTIGDQRPIRVVLVTGSSGMLGHHVLRELQDHPSVQEVRLFDTRPFENTLGHPMIKKTREVVASVCDIQALRGAVRGADAVIHCAALVPTTAAEDEAAFERINVQGTQNVVDACLEENVAYLVYTSTVAVITREEASGNNKPWYDGPYPETKARAEKIISEGHQRSFRNGSYRLRTLVLRLPPVYGELDHVVVPVQIKWAKKMCNTIFKLGPGFQVIYAGNAASAHVRALDALYENRAASGRCLVACDDTPVDIVAFLGPLIEGHDIRVFPRPVPYLPMLLLASCTQCIVGVLGHLFPGIRRGQVLKPSTIRYMYGGAFFDDAETRKALAWRPKYSPQEAARMSRSFYDTL